MYIAGMVIAYVSDLATRVKQLRAQHGWSQEQLAAAASRRGPSPVSRGWLSQVESGEIVKARSDLLNQLAKALNTSVDYLLNGAPPEGVNMTIPKDVAPTVNEIAQNPSLWRSIRAFLAASRQTVDREIDRWADEIPDDETERGTEGAG